MIRGLWFLTLTAVLPNLGDEPRTQFLEVILRQPA